MALSAHRKEICRRWREKHRERAAEQNREYYKRNSQERHEKQMEWRRQHKERRRSHRMVEYALAKGRLVKTPCAKCGDVRSEAHHHDYSKPLDVTWLCRACHGKEHRHAA